MNSNTEVPIDFSNPAVRDYMSLIRYCFHQATDLITSLTCSNQPTSSHTTIPFDKYRDHSSVFSRPSPFPWSVVPFVLSDSCSALLDTGDVTRSHPASISPWAPAIATYIFAIYLGQIGYCILLVIARKPETKARCCDLHCLLLTPDATEHNSQRCRPRSCICKLGHGRLGHCMGKWVSFPIAFRFIQLVLGF
jgi:hypothetical protein